MFYFFLVQDNLPNKFIVDLQQDDFWTNALLIINIVVSICVATFIKMRIDKKAKEFEVKAHIKKITAEKIMDFCLRANTLFRRICSKNPRTIDNSDIEKLNELITAEELLFISSSSENNIRDFRDYVLEIKDKPEAKDIRTEKSYFFLIKKIFNDL